jgi:hypothetical protein
VPLPLVLPLPELGAIAVGLGVVVGATVVVGAGVEDVLTGAYEVPGAG